MKLLELLQGRVGSDVNAEYSMIKTPIQVYGHCEDGQLWLDALNKLGIDPTTCWTARNYEKGIWLTSPGLWSQNGKVMILFNFEQSNRPANLCEAEGVVLFNPATQTYTLNFMGVDLPINPHWIDKPMLCPLVLPGIVASNLKEIPTGSGFTKVPSVMEILSKDQATILDATNFRMGSYEWKGKSSPTYQIDIVGDDGNITTVKLTPSQGRILNQYAVFDQLPEGMRLEFSAIYESGGYTTAKLTLLNPLMDDDDVPF
jgi:hypothetical protein